MDKKLALIPLTVIVIALVLAIVFLLILSNQSPSKITPITTEKKCPNGVLESIYVSTENLVRNATLTWYQRTLDSLNSGIASYRANLSSLVNEGNTTEIRGVELLIAETEVTEYGINYLYNMELNTPQTNTCDFVSNGSTSTLLAATNLIISDVGAMVSLVQSFHNMENESSCFHNWNLSYCLQTKWASAASTLDDLSAQLLTTNVSDSCSLTGLNASQQATWFNRLQPEVRNAMASDLKTAVSNSYKKAWSALKAQYDNLSSSASDEMTLLKKIDAAEVILQFKDYYDGLKAKGCA